MCYPALIVAAAAAATVAKSYGTYQSGRAQEAALNYQGTVASNNARIEEANATYATQKGELDAQARGMKTAAIVGEQKASFGAAGVEIGSDTAARVIGSTESIGALDAATIRNNAAREAYGHRVNAYGFNAQSVLDSYGARMARRNAILGGLTSLVGGASQLGMSGMFGSSAIGPG